MKTLASILILALLSGCAGVPQLDTVAPVAVQTAEALDPSISPAVAKACALTTAVTSAAIVLAPTDPKAAGAKAFSDASCGSVAAQAALTANDAKPVTASNSGNSASWLLTTVLPDALAAAKIAVAVAPLL